MPGGGSAEASATQPQEAPSYVEPSYFDLFGKAPPPRALFEGIVKSIDDFKAEPITLPAPPSSEEVPYTDANVRNGLNGWQRRVNAEGRDSHGQPFVNSTIDHSLEAQAKVEEERKKRYRGRHTERVQVPAEDSWKIGDPDSGWVEPVTTHVLLSTAVRVPSDVIELTAVLDAAYDFFDTRGPALLFNKTERHYWNHMRWALGLKAEFPGLHWPGIGPNAQGYQLQSRARRDSPREVLDAYRAGEIDEICPLLKHTERAVRGLLACARREAEAVWDLGGAIRLAEILRAFLAFVVHHRALRDAHIAPGLKRALALAQTAPLKLQESKAWEARIDDPHGLNVAGFALLCGNYYTRLQGITAGLAWELPPESEQPADEEEDVDDGGWGPPPGAASADRIEEPTPREAVSSLEPLFAPLPVSSVKLWNFIPFDRRRVIAVFPPGEPSETAPAEGTPAFVNRYHRFRSVPSPWTEEEAWKGRAPHKAAGDNTLDGNEHVSPGGLPFEQEKDTCEIPAELDVWVDCEGIENFDPQCVVGMGMRARWAQIGTEDQKWWIFKLKDYVLPSFWKSTEEDLALVASDPAPPYGDRLPAHMIPADPKAEGHGTKQSDAWDPAGDAKAKTSEQLDRDKNDGSRAEPKSRDGSGHAAAGKTGYEANSSPRIRNDSAELHPNTRGAGERAPRDVPSPGAASEERDTTAQVAPTARANQNVPPIKAVEVGKSDPDYFARNSYAAVGAEDDEVEGDEDEAYSDEDLVGLIPGDGDEDDEYDEELETPEAAADLDIFMKRASRSK